MVILILTLDWSKLGYANQHPDHDYKKNALISHARLLDEIYQSTDAGS